MSQVTLLSSGPSLLGYTPERRCGLVIGVNRAATRFACDWWCAGDEQTIHRHAFDQAVEPVLGAPHVCTMSPSLHAIVRGRPDIHAHHCQWIVWETLRDQQHPPSEFSYSCPVALVLAVHLGATEVITWGVDMVGETDFTGERGNKRKERRWEPERSHWHELVAWAGSRGVMVTRGVPAKAVAP